MRLKILHTIRILLVFLLLISPLSLVFAVETGSFDAQIRELDSKQKKLEEEANKYKSQASEARKEVRTYENAVHLINLNISKTNSNLESTQNEIELTRLELKQLDLEMQAVEEKLDEERDIMGAVLRSIYQIGDESLLEVLLKHESIAEFLKQAQYLEDTTDQLRELVQSLEEFNDSLKASKEDRQSKQVNLAQLESTLVVQQSVLSEQKSEKNGLLSLSRSEQQKFQSLASQVDKERRKLLSEIRELEAEVSRRKSYISFLESGSIPAPGTKLFRWPEHDPILTQGYGYTSFARGGAYGGSPHSGLDMVSGHGSPLLAAADGEVLVAGTNKGWGNWVALKHPGDLVTLYGHMRSPTHRSKGEKVLAGETIGYEGKTGYSTGSHLHFSVYTKFFTFMRGGELYFNYFEGTIDPLKYL